jgi:hypothetical protein
MLAAMLVFAAEEETSKSAFYIAGGVLVVWAVLVGATGVRRHERWPQTKRSRNGVLALTALLVAATVATSVLTG